LVTGRDEQLAESPCVDEAEVAALVERRDDVRVRRERRALGAADELPAHAEVHDEHIAGVELHQEVLALALHLGDLPADEERAELLALAVTADDAHGVLGRTDLHLLEAAADHVLLEIATHDLDFGKLHLSSLRSCVSSPPADGL